MVDLSTMLLSETVVSSGGTVRWMAPELLDPSRFDSDGRLTRESDCYALGMVVYEVGWLDSSRWSLIHHSQVLTGLRPFCRLHIHEAVVMLNVLRGERPEKPHGAESLGFSDELWGLVRLCWSESSSTRPTAQQLFHCLSSASANWAPPPVYPDDGTGAPATADLDPSSPLISESP